MVRRARGSVAVVAMFLGCVATAATGTEGDPLLPALRVESLSDGSTVLLNRDGDIAAVISGAESQGLVNSPPPQLPGWPLFVGEVDATPTVGDVAGDGHLRAVFATISDDGLLYVVDASAGIQPGWPQGGFRSGHTPSLADVDANGTLEIFAQGSLRMTGLRFDGASLPGWPQGSAGFSTAGIADVDGDGVPEIAAMGRNGMAHLWRPDGTEKPGWPFVFPNPKAGSNKGPALGDTDGDGTREVAIASNFGGPVYLLSHDGVLVSGFPFQVPAQELREGISMADLDQDGAQELVFAEDSTGLSVVDGQAQLLPGFPVRVLAGNSPPAIGDLDGDGRLEIVWATIGGNAQVFVYRDDGTPYPGWPVTVPTFSFNAQPTLGDVDGDGAVDIVLGGMAASFSSQGRIYAWHADGTPVPGFPFAVPNGKTVLGSSVTITDLDQDGGVDLLVGTVTGIGGTTDGRVFAFDLGTPYDPTTMEWPTLGHDPQHTARYQPPDRRPHAVISVPTVAECTSPDGAAVTLDGAPSEDPDSTPGTHDDIVRFEWFEDFGLATQVLLGTGEVVTVPLSLGSHAITLRVTDRPAAKHTATAAVQVVDTTPPALSVALDPNQLWPPNHRMVSIEATVQAADLCGPAETVLVSVVSSEADDAQDPEDGTTASDMQGAEIDTPDTAFELRAERSGAGTGRVYTATYRATDGAGNSTGATATVLVPHDQGDGEAEPLLLSVMETMGGTLLEWNPVSGAVSYSVLRGDVGSIHDDGAMFDLGPTTCVAAGITEPSTAGQEDPEHPASGSAFFYVAEYDDGRPSAYGSVGAAKPRGTSTAGWGCP